MTRRETRDRRPVLGVTMGDAAGIGPEVVAKGLADPAIRRLCRPIVIGSLPVMRDTVRWLRLPLRVTAISGHGEAVARHDLAVLDPMATGLGRYPIGKANRVCGEASVAFIRTAVGLAQDRCIRAIVTAPINKEAINLAGHRYPGHTEMLAALTKRRDVGMMIVGGPLKIMFVTTHVAMRELPAAITVNKIWKAIRLAHTALHDYFGIRDPRIAVAALNPHAGEGGLFGDEEQKKILPAVRRALAAGVRVTHPLPADTLFGKALRGDFDGVVAMFHDQGLIPLKMVAFGTCVNLTVGLPFIRTSVDHGTAYDIAGKGKADAGSFREALMLAVRLARRDKPRRAGESRVLAHS